MDKICILAMLSVCKLKFDICHNLCMSIGLETNLPRSKTNKKWTTHIGILSIMAVLVGILSKKWAKTPKKEHLSD